MRHDAGRGSGVDVRARRAARQVRQVVAQLLPHAPADLERFERIRHRRRRNERVKAIVVAAVVAILAAVEIVHMLPRSNAPAHHPVPARGNGRIVFGRSAVGLDQRSLFTIDPDGSDELRLPQTTTDCGEWSPDGTRLHVTASEYPGAPLRPAIVNADGSGLTIVHPGAPRDLNLGCGDWSPDGSRLVLEGFGRSPAVNGIYVVTTNAGSTVTRLTHGFDVVPQYAPDGSAVVFQRTDGPRSDHAGAAALFVIGSDGSDLRRITPWGAASSAGSWSDTDSIVFAGPNDTLWTVRPDGTDLARLLVELDGRPFQPRWSPDGTAIVFGLRTQGQTDIYTVRRDGSALTRVTDTPGVDEWWPDWGVG